MTSPPLSPVSVLLQDIVVKSLGSATLERICKNTSGPRVSSLAHLLRSWLKGFGGRLASNREIPVGLLGGYFLCLPWRTSRGAPSCSPHGPSPALRLTRTAGQVQVSAYIKPVSVVLRAFTVTPAWGRGQQGGANPRPSGQAAPNLAKRKELTSC